MAKAPKLVKVTYQCEDGSTLGMWTENPAEAQHALVATKLKDDKLQYVLWYAATREELDRQVQRHAATVAKHIAANQIQETSYAVAVA